MKVEDEEFIVKFVVFRIKWYVEQLFILFDKDNMVVFYGQFNFVLLLCGQIFWYVEREVEGK